MTGSERQKKSKKHCVVAAAKQYGKTKKSITPTPPEIENDPPPPPPLNSDKGPSGGPIDKSVLKSFNDHIAYAIWNQTKVLRLLSCKC
ncbi:hypothetical protein LguiA_017993 [Lonicera macranthoides]